MSSIKESLGLLIRIIRYLIFRKLKFVRVVRIKKNFRFIGPRSILGILLFRLHRIINANSNNRIG